MITTIPPHTNEISTLDALWTLYLNQSKRVQKAFLKRLKEHEKAEISSREMALERDMTPEELYDVISDEIDAIYANG